jgi:hypothetical protein
LEFGDVDCGRNVDSRVPASGGMSLVSGMQVSSRRVDSTTTNFNPIETKYSSLISGYTSDAPWTSQVQSSPETTSQTVDLRNDTNHQQPSSVDRITAHHISVLLTVSNSTSNLTPLSRPLIFKLSTLLLMTPNASASPSFLPLCNL